LAVQDKEDASQRSRLVFGGSRLTRVAAPLRSEKEMTGSYSNSSLKQEKRKQWLDRESEFG
jgi:hypothetical protein